MSSSSKETSSSQSYHRHRYSMCTSKGHWSAKNIIAMVLGFIVFWPIGLFIVFWVMSGRHVESLPSAIKTQWKKLKGKGEVQMKSESGNVIFDEYQQTQYDRIREIKQEIKDRAHRFTDFKADAQRRADKEEFNQFMNQKPNDGATSS